MVITKVVEWTPHLLKTVLKLAPERLNAIVFEQTLTQVFAHHADDSDLAFLTGRKVGIRISDLDLSMTVTYLNNDQSKRFSVHCKALESDVTLRLTWAACLALATQQVDPDTLFFRRELAITGDTELGLQLKNVLDTIELRERLPSFVYQRLQLLAQAAHISR